MFFNKNLIFHRLVYILLIGLSTYSLGFGQGATCSTSSPFCTNNTYSFPNLTNNPAPPAGNNYSCLSTQPNPAWFYMQIGTSGNLVFDITQTDANGTGLDVDFILYGPFPTLGNAASNCGNMGNGNGNNSVQDCSYDPAAVETANLNSAIAGEVYVMLITNYSNNPGTIVFSQTGGTGSTNCGILPVELTSFNGDCDNNSVQLYWSTASEINNDYFTIEKSYDAINFIPINTINGHGNSSSPISYSYIDDDDGQQAYYRLKQTDFNGAFKYYPPISVKCEGFPIFSLYPNPVKNELTISVTKAGNYSIKIVDYIGRTVMDKSLNNSLSQKIDLSTLHTQGVYFASLYSKDGELILVEKIFKQ